MASLTELMIGLIIFGLVLTGVSLYTIDLGQRSGSAATVQNLSNLGGVDKVQVEAQALEESTQRVDFGLGISTDSPFVTVPTSIVNAVKLSITTITLVLRTTLPAIAGYLGLPGWFTAGITAIISLILVSAVIGIITGRIKI